MITPLLWLLLATVGLQASPDFATWEGRPVLVVTRPASPTPGQQLRLTAAAMPLGARQVVFVLEGRQIPARPAGNRLYRATTLAPQAPGPSTLTIRFTVGTVRYEAPGAVVVVAAPDETP